MVPWPQPLRRGTRVLFLCLLVQSRLQLAAPLPQGLEGKTPEESKREWAKVGPSAGQQKGGREELFQDLDPEALTAVLLQALQTAPQGSAELPLSPKARAAEERTWGGTGSSDVWPESLQGGPSSQDRDRPQEEAAEEAEERVSDQQELENLKSMLKELQHFSPTDQRGEPSYRHPVAPSESPQGPHPDDVLKELEEYQQLKPHTKRRAPPQEPWAGARKLRQQQHLEHQLLQRRYEELAESRRQAEEARRAAAEEERLADVASDLLLQYLLKDGEEEEEGQRGANAQEEPEGGGGSKEASLLFGDGEDNVAEDKRSNETPEVGEEEEEDIDPNTIDRLIELSSKLHLPADDVIDIINDVEKKKKEEGEGPEARSKARPLGAPFRSKPRKAPPHPGARQEARPIPKAFQTYRHLPKQEEAAWNEVLKVNEFPLPKRYQAKDEGTDRISNHISPRTFQTPAHHHYRHLPGPTVPREGYYDIQAHDEDLENYLENLLMKHPKVFQ